MDPDTALGGPHGRFPLTQRSAVAGAASADPQERRRALDILIAAYWKPVYKYIRLQWNEPNDAAKDLTQGFFTAAMEKGFFDAYDPEKGSFRTFLRTCVDGYISKERRRETRLKRGGGELHVSLDFEDAEGEVRRLEPAGGLTPEELFQREWARSVMSLALERFSQECETGGRLLQYRLFERYDLQDPAEAGRATYAELAAEHGISATDVTNHLAAMRRGLRRTMLALLGELTVSEQEFRREALWLLGVERG